MPRSDAAIVGRMHERDELRDVLDACEAGRGSLILLVGDAGMGKTRLADALSDEARARGFRTAWGRAWEAGGAPAYWPWLQLARELGIDLPEGPRAAADAAQARFAFFDAVTCELRRATESSPCLLVLDDLHVADGASLALLEFVARELRSLRALVVGTYRPVDARHRGEPWRQLMRIARDGTHMPLRPLSSEEIGALAAQVAHDTLDAESLELITHRSEGNPLFVRELARWLSGRTSSSAKLPVPDDVRAVIEARLALLDAGARAVLERAAVAGRELPRRLLASLPSSAVADALASATRAGILDDSDPATVHFSHVLYRDVLYDAIESKRRAELHAELAGRLERLGDREHLDEIAHHRIAAVGFVPISTVATSVANAARRALDNLAFEHVAALIERALDVLDFAELSHAHHVELLLLLGEAHIRLGGRDHARDSCRRVRELAREAGDPASMARAALVLGLDITPGVIDAELVSVLEECLAQLPAGDSAIRALVMGRLASAEQPALDYHRPMARAREAIAMARRTGDRDILRRVLVSAVSAMAGLGPPAERSELNAELVALSMAAGDVLSALRGHVRLFFDRAELGDMAGARDHLASYQRQVATIGLPNLRWQPHMLQSMLALFEGRFEDAEAARADAKRVYPRQDPRLQLALTAHAMLSASLRGDWTALDAIEPDVRHALEHTAIGNLVAPAWFARGRLRRGDHDAARRYLRHAVELGLSESPLLFLWAEVIAAVGDEPLRRRAYELLGAHGRDRLFGLDMVPMVFEEPITCNLGLLAASLGRPDEARELLDDAIARLETMGGHAFLPRVRRVREELDALDGGAPPATRAQPPRAEPAFRLTREGDYYTVESTDGITRLKSTRGLALLAELLREPGREQLALTLMGGTPGADVGDAGPALDAQAMIQYRRRLAELREALEDAEERHDAERAEAARSEMDAIAQELAHSVGLGGRARPSAAAAERARINVQRHLKKAIAAIAEAHPALGRHLRQSVRTGRTCTYRPD